MTKFNRMAEIDPRIIFAAERTMLAWIRTGLSLMGLGFVVSRFSLLLKDIGIISQGHQVTSPGLSLWIGLILVILGVFMNLYAGISYSQNLQRIQNNLEVEIKIWPFGRIISLVLSGLGLVMASYLLLIK